MEIQRLHYPLPPDFQGEVCVLAMGYFDGVHVGHRRVIQKAIDIAKSLGVKSAVMTFDPHPREVLGQSGYTQYLTPIDEKLEQMKKMGVDIAYVVYFDISFAAIYPEDFIDEFLVQLCPKHVVVGFDYTFGHRGKGTAITLKEHANGRYGVEVIAPVNRFGEKISSTLIREYLYSGKIVEATQFLGRPYRVRGTVVHGEKRGRTIGFPTANIQLSAPYIVPRNGVYGVRVELEDKTYYGVMNVGIKPTFENERKEKSLEVHLFDFAGDIYGKAIEVEFWFFIREEQKFSSVDALVVQIHEDVETVKKQFAKYSIV
ncbi:MULTISPECIES: bifunctional riboflavin kinase/FAD synthetase [Aneurinibacillus]|uniref:Riboflavin biosynthesis protein n=1 Tax=Aneurinibacillus thermoaerophilus TaxID=143495 RepID=A0ABX8Y778_ANETH|nr:MULTISPECIES: bifunctional riboflavin kinase/FAD synthetase [Aneurinibacillus]AMA72711.1 bifunctional riboflavin kinase/FMN adenylyltransferase [Aneurinibacillus sp. XH2]MED0677935.1 bifunctional riboflavin kinase/FAD synthetase [Aneurinibacillus thermoaerophilus]MED0737002.1 bifunctional riboflavin kinase/FAD synthetase [Aneurinibacillus thermoaerophilus]MED0756843.1 bifunctional riboflavin kinase/FAD synthetase [Aneurinibacillus thermoaerophilus]MED0760893.1 bifunctional riboflavin kinase